MPEIVIYSESFPYGTSEPFLETEVKYLVEYFDTIYIQPLNGTGIARELPFNCILLEPLQTKKCKKSSKYLEGLRNVHLLLSEKTLRNTSLKVSVFKRIKYIGYGVWLKKRLKNKLIYSARIHYSYWLNYGAIALAMLKRENAIKLVISRAHRFDLFTGTGENGLDYMKPFTLYYIQRIFLISQDGFNFINDQYPDYSFKYRLSKLGTKSPELDSSENIHDSLFIVSCSNLKPVKRVGIILEALILFNKSHPELAITWTHIGDGDIMESLKYKVSEKLKHTPINCNLIGELSNKFVIVFYRENPIDIFLNVSKSEGVPVSIMEAQSCGIPVVATAVGGNSEIVNDENGLLLNAKITPEKLADILFGIYTSKEKWKKKRILSKENWEQNYNAERNYKSFATELTELLESFDNTESPNNINFS